MNRRGIVIGAAGVVAVGAGLAYRLLQPAQNTQAAPAAEAMRDWERTEFDRPEGGKLALATFAGKPLLLNFWATWCPPCVKEMPMLDSFAREHRGKGWQVVGLAIDRIEPVREFLAKHPVSYPIGVADLEALQWLRSLGNVGGGLPFSIVRDSTGASVQRKLGELSTDELAAWAATVK